MKPPFRVFFAGLVPALFLSAVFCASCASSGATAAEEYFSLGMAFFDLGKYEEAEKWLNRAREADKTMAASEYNLGRIAFERGRYEEAVGLFQGILDRDPENVLALKALAYTRIKTNNLEEAETVYSRVLALTPESADDGYNYALVLFALEKYDDAEKVLLRHPYALEENSDLILLHARVQKVQDKVEAIDTYAKWLLDKSSPQVQYEYGQVLEKAEFFARAQEQYQKALESLPQNSKNPKKQNLLFTLGRLLLTADPENPEGIKNLESAITEGFEDVEALKTLVEDSRLSKAHQDALRTSLDNLVKKIASRDAGSKAAESGSEAEAGKIPEASGAAAPAETPRSP